MEMDYQIIFILIKKMKYIYTFMLYYPQQANRTFEIPKCLDVLNGLEFKINQ